MDSGLKVKVVPDNTGNPEYKETLERIEKRNVCPFCPAFMKTEHTEPVIGEGKYWLVTRNFKPYPDSRAHFLLVLKRHAENLSDLSSKEQLEAMSLAAKTARDLGIKDFGFCMRSGDPRRTGATVNHLHIHIIEPRDFGEEKYSPVKFRVGARKH